MKPEEMIEVYKMAYKKAFDWPWKKQALPKPPNPTLIPSPFVASNGMDRNQNRDPWDNRGYYDVPQSPTWTDPTDENQVLDFQHRWGTGTVGPVGYNSRRAAQANAVSELNDNLRNGVSPRITDAYHPENGSFNMSREAMLRRINMLTRQRSRDEKIRAANVVHPWVNK